MEAKATDQAITVTLDPREAADLYDAITAVRLGSLRERLAPLEDALHDFTVSPDDEAGEVINEAFGPTVYILRPHKS